jgi:hypothetical protein
MGDTPIAQADAADQEAHRRHGPTRSLGSGQGDHAPRPTTTTQSPCRPHIRGYARLDKPLAQQQHHRVRRPFHTSESSGAAFLAFSQLPPVKFVGMVEKRAPDTHTAFAARRIGKKAQHVKWVEIGTGRADSGGIVHVFLDRLPIGGFTGYVRLSPSGAKPSIEPVPQHPDEDFED